tara:strand:- start:7943 stop:8593 length:651 start_codon:yes stop_codon:yes gene_type:complete
MGFLSQLANVFTGSEDAKARQKAGDIQQEQALNAISQEIKPAGQRSLDYLSPYEQAGQQGLSQVGFLTDPQAQMDFAKNNPLFQLSRDMLTEDLNQSAASRGRLSSGDTLVGLQNAGVMAAQPLINQQKQSIFDLMRYGGGMAGNMANIDMGTAQQVTDLLTGGAAAKAAGAVGGQNARTGAMGNTIDLAVGAVDLFGRGGGFGSGGFSANNLYKG